MVSVSFVKLDEEDYVLAAKGHVLHVSQEDDTVTFYDTEEDEYVNVWKDYFDMDRDYSAIKKKLLEKDDKLKDAIESMWGVRILNQDFFETLISFIISQNKQIPHIKKIVADISAKFGTYKEHMAEQICIHFQHLNSLSMQVKRTLKS